MSMNVYEAYQNNAVKTASGGDLTLMLYNGCIKFIRRAIKYVQEENYELKNENIQKAQAIIQELMVTLNPEIDISEQMMSLYDYINHQLREGNIKNDEEHLQEALSYVIEFRDTWKQALLNIKKQTSKQHTKGVQTSG
ncbi:MAG TPA: flagellar export chaperone FliS [Bacillota bacterium]|nr:flagellar export chaperone FliS [Bacillota bacterium]